MTLGRIEPGPGEPSYDTRQGQERLPALSATLVRAYYCSC